jgi:hypothetical protein
MTMQVRGKEAGRQACVLYTQRFCFDTLQISGVSKEFSLRYVGLKANFNSTPMLLDVLKMVLYASSEATESRTALHRGELWSDDVSAVSEANGATVRVSLDLRSSLSIQPLEGSRSRVRRTRGAMGIQSISA